MRTKDDQYEMMDYWTIQVVNVLLIIMLIHHVLIFYGFSLKTCMNNVKQKSKIRKASLFHLLS